jgi:hypothetical protein
MPPARPSAPNTTSSVCAASTTSVMTTGHARATASGDGHTIAPAARASASASGRMSRTWTSYPCASRRFATPMPIAPIPITPARAAIVPLARRKSSDGAVSWPGSSLP